MNPVNRHLVYYYFLNSCLMVRRPNPNYRCDCHEYSHDTFRPMGEGGNISSGLSVERCLHDVMTPYLTEEDYRAIKQYWNPSPIEMAQLRSVPSETMKLIFPPMIEKQIALHRIPGFYFQDNLWRMFLPFKKGILKPYYNGTDFIQGIMIYPHVKAEPSLFESVGLPFGARAVPFNPHLEKAA